MNDALRVLVVDDDRGMARTLVDIFRVKGYEAEAANSGSSAPPPAVARGNGHRWGPPGALASRGEQLPSSGLMCSVCGIQGRAGFIDSADSTARN